MWLRKQSHMAVLWDVHQKRRKTPSVEFQGFPKPSKMDANKKELFYPWYKSMGRLALSWLATLAFCGLNAVVVLLWLGVYDGRLNIVASIVQALIIQIFTLIYNPLVEKLTLAENHKFREDYYDSYLVKMFIFQFVNQYFGFFYIAIRQQFTEAGCMFGGNCVLMLNIYIPTTLLSLACMRVVQVVVATLKVKIVLWWETRQMTKAGLPAPNYTYVEKQTKFGNFQVREQVEVMSSLVLSLGFILIFGAVAPIIVPLCLLIFAVQLRAGAVLLTSAVNRPMPSVSMGIGPWNDIVLFLTILGIFFSGYLTVQFGTLFEGTMLLTKLSCLCMYVATVLSLWVVVDYAVPPTSDNALLIDERREYVMDKMHDKEQDAILSRLEKAEAELDLAASTQGAVTPRTQSRTITIQNLTSTTPYSKEIATGDWSGIPKVEAEDSEGDMERKASVFSVFEI